MLTVVLGCVASGTSSTRKPLRSVYSVTPSTVGPWATPAGSVAAAAVDTRAMQGSARRASERKERMFRESWAGTRKIKGKPRAGKGIPTLPEASNGAFGRALVPPASSESGFGVRAWGFVGPNSFGHPAPATPRANKFAPTTTCALPDPDLVDVYVNVI